MTGVVAFFVWALLAYLVVVNGVYLLLNLLAVRTVREKVTLRQLENLPPVQATLVPPVSVIVAARDDEDGVVDRVRAALALDYPRFEVLVVNDGSRDATLDRLREAFALEAFPEVYWRRITVKPVRTIYHSRLHRNLRVVDKERGGSSEGPVSSAPLPSGSMRTVEQTATVSGSSTKGSARMPRPPRRSVQRGSRWMKRG